MTQDPIDFKTYGGVSLKALEDVIIERRKQDSQWGGPDGDDTNMRSSWFEFIEHQIQKPLPLNRLDEVGRMKDYRDRMIKIAALAIAAVESLDRKMAK